MTNGLIFDSDGVLYAREGGARRVVRYGSDGSITVLADGFEGSKLNIPNDLAIDPRGRVWFTDLYYKGVPTSRDWTRGTTAPRAWPKTRVATTSGSARTALDSTGVPIHRDHDSIYWIA